MSNKVTRLINVKNKKEAMTDSYIKKRIKEVDIEVGHKIRQSRQEKGLSQRELGTLIGCSFQQVQKYENGSNHVNVPRLILISEALEVSVNSLINKAKNANSHKSNISAKTAVSLADLPPSKQKVIREMIEALKKT